MIKNIFWDVDGVLANLNYAYFQFLTHHPKYQSLYGNMKWEDLPKVLPVSEKYGALELKTHPTLGKQMDEDFCHTLEFFTNRPLYPDAIETLKYFHSIGLKQFTLSATFDVETKKRFLNTLLHDVTDFLIIECVQHGQFMHDTAKTDMLRTCFAKYHLKPEETILVDDRIYNQYAAIEVGAHPVRYRSEFTTDLPEDLKSIPEVKNFAELKQLIDDVNNGKKKLSF
ncbi:MAG: HAD family hydrolase [Alphaproteobacteria bacterium]|nr:HAD family hydrolase [Alphaproteobacteria bacterium]